jgi:hypothetical protein
MKLIASLMLSVLLVLPLCGAANDASAQGSIRVSGYTPAMEPTFALIGEREPTVPSETTGALAAIATPTPASEVTNVHADDRVSRAGGSNWR